MIVPPSKVQVDWPPAVRTVSVTRVAVAARWLPPAAFHCREHRAVAPAGPRPAPSAQSSPRRWNVWCEPRGVRWRPAAAAAGSPSTPGRASARRRYPGARSMARADEPAARGRCRGRRRSAPLLEGLDPWRRRTVGAAGLRGADGVAEEPALAAVGLPHAPADVAETTWVVVLALSVIGAALRRVWIQPPSPSPVWSARSGSRAAPRGPPFAATTCVDTGGDGAPRPCAACGRSCRPGR